MKNLKLLLVLLVGIEIMIAAYFGVKTTYLGYDSANHRFGKTNIFYKDGGVYTSNLIVSDNRAYFESQEWFRQIKKISDKDLNAQWGYYAGRVKHIFKPVYWGFSVIGRLAFRFTKNYQEAFRATILIFPFFLLAKYVFLFVVFCPAFLTKLGWPKAWLKPPGGMSWPLDGSYPIFLSVVFIDFFQPYGHNLFWFTSSAYAMIFLSTGAVLRVFHPSFFLSRWVAYALMISGALNSQIVIPVVASLGAVDLLSSKHPKLFSKLAAFCTENFALVAFGLTVATVPVAALYFVGGALKNPNRAFEAIHYFNQQTGYLGGVNIPLFFLYGYMAKNFRASGSWATVSGAANLMLEKITIATLALVFGGFLLVAVSPLISAEMQINSYRLIEHIYLFLVLGIGFALAYDQKWRKILAPALVCCGLGLGLARILPEAVDIHSVHAFKPTDFPELSYSSISGSGHASQPAGGELKYFLARDPQQVIGYFLRELYREAPLVLDIKTPTYDPRQTVELLK